MTIRFPIAAALLAATVLGGCTQTVDNFKDRVLDQNAQYHDLMNDEALLNIIRASRFEAVSFVALGQTGGYRTQGLNIGLPAVTIGPGRTVAQKQFAFAGNSESNQVQGIFQSNALGSDTFQLGMMAPISPRQLAMLIAAHGREAVLLAAVDQIRINEAVWLVPDGQTIAAFTKANPNPTRIESHIFRNAPSDNEIAGSDAFCSASRFLPDADTEEARNAKQGDAKYVGYVLGKITAQKSGKYYLIGDMRECNFAKFRALLTALLRVGLTVDVNESDKTEDAASPSGAKDPVPPPEKKDSKKPGAATPATSNNAAQQASQTKFCLNAALVDPPIDLIQGPTVLGGFGRCEFVPKDPAQIKVPVYRGRDAGENKSRWGYLEEVSFRLRSPIGIYNYLGEVMRSHNAGKGPAGLFTYSTYDAKMQYGLGDTSPFLNVIVGEDGACAASIEDGGKRYCVKEGEVSTLNLLAMLQDLRNFNTKTSDLNTSFTVRVAP